MIILLYFALAFVGVLLYLRKRFVSFLMLIILLVNDFFGVFPESIYSNDAVFLMSMFILFVENKRGEKVFSIKEDPIGQIIILMILWVAFRAVLSMFNNEDTIMYSVKVIRHDLFLLVYFVLRRIKVDYYIKFFKLLFPLMTVVGIIAIFLMLSGDEHSNGNVFQRKALIAIATPLLFMTITKDIKIHHKNIYMVVMAVLVTITFARGFFIAAATSVIVYFLLFTKQSLKRKLLIIPVLAILFLSYNMMEQAKNDETGAESAKTELSDAMNMSSYNEFRGGSFILRFAMVWERIDYFSQHPRELMIGIGSIHEDSPNNKLSFMIGSNKTNTEDIDVKQMIDTEDVAILSHWLRYGTIWLILFVIFIIRSLKISYKYRNRIFMKTLFMLMLTFTITSASLDCFSAPIRFIMALLLISIPYQYNIVNKKVLINNT